MSEAQQLQQYNRQLDMMTKYPHVHHLILLRVVDHAMIAFSFFFLGVLLMSVLGTQLLKRKVRLDYEIPKGSIMRMNTDKKRWLIVNPTSLFEYYDVILLSFFDKGESQFLERHNKKRIRRITIFIIVTISLMILAWLFSFSHYLHENPFLYMLEK